MGVSFAVMLLHHLATDYDSKSILYLSAALQFASLGLLLSLAWPLLPNGPRRRWHALLIALMMLSLAPTWNILWGFQTASYLITFFLIACLWFLARAAYSSKAIGAGSIAAAATCAALASLSSVHGLAVWLAGGVYLFFSGLAIQQRKRAAMSILLWLGRCVVFLVLYLWIYRLTPTVHSSPNDLLSALAAGPLALGRFAVGMLSTFFDGHLGRRALLAGSAVALFCALACIAALSSENRSRFALPLALLAFALAFVLMVTVGRYRFGDSAALESRYGSCVILAVIASYLILMRPTGQARPRPAIASARVLLVVFVVIAFVLSTITAMKAGRKWRLERGIGAMILLNAAQEPRFKIERTIHFSPGLVIEQAAQLRDRGLSTFADGPAAIPRQAAAHSIPPASWREFLDRRPGERKALERLWDVYVIGPELRATFPLLSPTLPAELIRWATKSARGNHYLTAYLIDFSADYERLRDELAAPSAARP